MLNHKNTKIMDAETEKRISERVVKQVYKDNEKFYEKHVFYYNEIIEEHRVVYFLDLLRRYDIMIIDYDEYKVKTALSDLFSINEIATGVIHQQINNK